MGWQDCQLIELYEFLGKKWSVALLHNINEEKFSFNDMKRKTKGFISSPLLSSRLKQMVTFKLIDKLIEGNRIFYVQTSQCVKLKKILHDIKHWAIDQDYNLPKICKTGKCVCDNAFDN